MLLNYFTTPLINIIYLQSKIQQAKVANNCLQEVYVVNKEEKGQLKDLSFKQLDLKVLVIVSDTNKRHFIILI